MQNFRRKRTVNRAQFYRPRLEQLEVRNLLSGLVEIESATVRDICAEHDGVQEKFFAVQQVNGQPTRSDAFGTTFSSVAIPPGYDTAGQSFLSPDFRDCPLSDGNGEPDQLVHEFRSLDEKYVLAAYQLSNFPAPPMQVTVGNVTVLAHLVTLYARVTGTHYPNGLNIYSNSSVRWKFLDPVGAKAKYTDSLFFGPVTQVGDLPSAPIERLTLDFQDLTFDETYRNGGSSRIVVKEISVERTQLEFQVGFHTDSDTPFTQFTGMVKSSPTFVYPDNSDVQIIATHNSDGYSNEHVLDFTGTLADTFYAYRSQRPDRDTLSGPDFIITFDPTRAPVFLDSQVIDLLLPGGGFTNQGNATHDKAAPINPGQTTSFPIRVDKSGSYLVAFTYSHDNEFQHELTTTLSNQTYVHPLLDTGEGLASGFGWDQWNTTNFGTKPVLLEANVTQQLDVTTTGRVELDTIVLIRIPRVTLPNTTTMMAENTSTPSRRKVADIVISNDALGTNTLSLSGVDAGMFEIDTGVLYLRAGATLDYETNPVLNVMVAVVGAMPDDTAPLAINVTDENERPTNITLSASTVAENTAGALIGVVTVVDPDVGNSHTLGVGDARFEIVADQLKLKSGQSLDFEASPTINLQITVTDAGGLAKSQTFTITVTNVNEPASALTLDATNARENVTGMSVGTLSATDPETTDTHSYSVSDARFEIVGSTLKLKVDRYLARTDGAQVSIDVTATDSGSPPQSLTKTLTIVVDANPFPWHDSVNPLDVDGDGHIAPVDALIIINELNDPLISAQNLLPIARPAVGNSRSFDTLGDGFVAPIDVLLVINFLNEFGASEGKSGISTMGAESSSADTTAQALFMSAGLLPLPFASSGWRSAAPISDGASPVISASELRAATVLKLLVPAVAQDSMSRSRDLAGDELGRKLALPSGFEWEEVIDEIASDVWSALGFRNRS